MPCRAGDPAHLWLADRTVPLAHMPMTASWPMGHDSGPCKLMSLHTIKLSDAGRPTARAKQVAGFCRSAVRVVIAAADAPIARLWVW